MTLLLQAEPRRLYPRTPVLSATDSQAWIDALRGQGPARDEAVARLHDLLLRGARFEVNRRSAALGHMHGESADDLAQQAADDALVSVLGKLDDFRGESRFSTWAYKFAIFEAGTKLRRRAWQHREVVLEPESWPDFADASPNAQREVEGGELLAALKRAMAECLSERQRQVFVALALNEVPIDVLAERLDTNRGALYKTLHDARRKLRRELAAAGYAEEGR